MLPMLVSIFSLVPVSMLLLLFGPGLQAVRPQTSRVNTVIMRSRFICVAVVSAPAVAVLPVPGESVRLSGQAVGRETAIGLPAWWYRSARSRAQVCRPAGKGVPGRGLSLVARAGARWPSGSGGKDTKSHPFVQQRPLPCFVSCRAALPAAMEGTGRADDCLFDMDSGAVCQG